MTHLQVMSFNIKNSRSNYGTVFAWEHRKEKIIQIVHHYRPDIIGFQEVFEDQLEYLAEHLNPEYSYQGVGRDDGAREGEFCPIFYKGLSCNLKGTFWYSDTPEKCSNTWNMYLPRICTWINFKDSIAFYNTHLDDRDSNARKKSFELLLNQMDKNSPNLEKIVVGDFNCNHNSQHGFTGKKRSPLALNGRRIIDHIIVSKKIHIIDSKLLYYNVGGHQESYPSDHWPILANLEFR
ncbi:MAG: endonuclease/exonuclease/phosphatase family protein [Candidatus Hodarchaeales archaeon]